MQRILDDAFDFCARGKGQERHGGEGLYWDEQRHVTIGEAVGRGFALGQALKKIMESENENFTPEQARRELLGAISYIASAIYLIEQGID